MVSGEERGFVARGNEFCEERATRGTRMDGPARKGGEAAPESPPSPPQLATQTQARQTQLPLFAHIQGLP